MVFHVAKSRFSSEEEHISFPADAVKVRYDMIGLEEFGGWAPAHIIGGEGAADILTGYIKRDELFSEDGIQKLNSLAELVDAMDMEAQNIFAGALRLENTDNLDDVLRVAGSLDNYEMFPSIKTDEELGHFLVDTGPITGKFVFAEEAKPYLDYAKIGAEQRKLLNGVHSDHGFVKRREVVQEQAVGSKPKFLLTLTSPTGTVRLNLPAFEDDLEQAKRALGLDSLDSAVIRDAEIGYAWAHLIPMDSITLEDANTLAQCVRAMSKRELKVFGAVLEVEEPSSLYDAGCTAMDLDDYELVDSNEGEYGREALRRAGADDEVLDMLDGFTDFDALGRFEMEEDGVRETSFGSVRRLSAPWPREPELGQAMG